MVHIRGEKIDSRKRILEMKLCNYYAFFLKNTTFIREMYTTTASYKSLSCSLVYPFQRLTHQCERVIYLCQSRVYLCQRVLYTFVKESCIPLSTSLVYLSQSCIPLSKSLVYLSQSCIPLSKSLVYLSQSCIPLSKSLVYLSQTVLYTFFKHS